MKKQFSLILSMFVVLSLLSLSSTAQNKKSKANKATKVESVSTSATAPAWAEMDAFEQLLSSTSAAANKGNMAPIREKASELTVLSIQFAKSEYPEVNDNMEFRTVVGEFTDRCEELERFVSNTNNSDAAIVAEIAKLERSFAEIKHMRQSQIDEKKD